MLHMRAIKEVFYDDWLSAQGIWDWGKMPSMGVFLTVFGQGSKKTTENSEQSGQQAWLGSNPIPPFYQFWEQNLSATQGARLIKDKQVFFQSRK